MGKFGSWEGLKHMVPWVVTKNQTEECIHICCDWLVVDNSNINFFLVITGDKSWGFEYNSVKKRSDSVFYHQFPFFNKNYCNSLNLNIIPKKMKKQ